MATRSLIYPLFIRHIFNSARFVFIIVLIPACIYHGLFFTIQFHSMSHVNNDWAAVTQYLNINSLKNSNNDRDSYPTYMHAYENGQIGKHTKAFIERYSEKEKGCESRPFKPYLLSALQESCSKANTPAQNSIGGYNTLLVFSERSERLSVLQNSIIRLLESKNINQIYFLFSMESKSKYARFPELRRFISKAYKGRVILNLIHSKGLLFDLCTTRMARNLLVHGYAGAALAAIVSASTVYFTDAFDSFAQSDRFRWMVNELVPLNESIWPGYKTLMQSFSGMGKVRPTCCKLSTFGDGEDKKVICKNARGFSNEVNFHGLEIYNAKHDIIAAPCWVLSLGCGGKWTFEEAIVSKTNCVVQTFDCTGVFSVPYHLRSRVKFHNICVTVSGDERGNYKSLVELIKIGSRASKVSYEKPPALVKMDIEGYEHPVLYDLLENGNESLLPEQLLLEIHASFSTQLKDQFRQQSHLYAKYVNPNIQELFRRLSSRNYSLVHRADNKFCTTCTEVTLMRLSGLPKQ